MTTTEQRATRAPTSTMTRRLKFWGPDGEPMAALGDPRPVEPGGTRRQRCARRPAFPGVRFWEGSGSGRALVGNGQTRSASAWISC